MFESCTFTGVPFDPEVWVLTPEISQRPHFDPQLSLLKGHFFLRKKYVLAETSSILAEILRLQSHDMKVDRSACGPSGTSAFRLLLIA